MSRLPILLSATCVLSFHALAQTPSFDPAPWRQDYTTLKAALEKRYSNLAWFASPEGGVDLPALDRRTAAAIDAATNDDDARRAILTFVTSFHDGHFSPVRAPAEPRAANEKPAAPVYSRQDAAGGCEALKYGAVRAAGFSLPFDSLPGFESLSDGTTHLFRAGILSAGDPATRLGIVRIPEFESNYRLLCLANWDRPEVWDEQGKFRRGALRRAMEQGWYAALAELLQKFRSAGAAAVLVDIGNNSGGDDSGDIAARLFTSLPLHSAPLWVSQDSTTAGAYLDEQVTALRRALEFEPGNQRTQESLAWFTGQKEKMAQACPMNWVWRERRSWSSDRCRRIVEAGSAGGPLAYLAPDDENDLRIAERLHWPATVRPLWGTWTGPVYLLTDNHTYSAAEMFAAVMQNNHAAKTIGRLTGGDGCGFMNSTDPVVLPNSGLRFRVPNCVRMRADGTDEVSGIKPDIPLMAGESDDPRAMAQRATTELLADLRRSSGSK